MQNKLSGFRPATIGGPGIRDRAAVPIEARTGSGVGNGGGDPDAGSLYTTLTPENWGNKMKRSGYQKRGRQNSVQKQTTIRIVMLCGHTCT